MPGIDSNTKLMLHMNGPDGSATFIDDSASAHTVVANNNFQIDTAQSKFAGASGLSDGTTDWLQIADSPDWDFGTDDYTIDMWISINSLATDMVLCSRYSGENKDSWILELYSNGKLRMYAFNSSGVRSDSAGGGGWYSTTVLAINTWYHIAMVQTTDKLQVYIDGNKDIDLNPFPQNIDNNIPLIIGAFNTSGGSSFNGWMDEFRVSKGIARWTANFTPPAEEYTGLIKSALNQRWSLTAPTLIKEFLNQLYALDAPSGLYQAVLNQLYALDAPTGPYLIYLEQRYILNGHPTKTTILSVVIYTLTLTGAPDGLSDITLPMGSFQSRLKDGDPSYLSVNIPNGRQYADDVNARPNGELVVTRTGTKEDGSPESVEIARVNLENIRTDEGGRSSSITLSGHKTTSNSTPKGISLDDISYKATYSGKRHVRSKMDGNVAPGDQANIDGEVFIIGEVTRYVNPRSAQMEVVEA